MMLSLLIALDRLFPSVPFLLSSLQIPSLFYRLNLGTPFAPSPQATAKSRSTFIDATLAPYECGKRFSIRFVFGTVTEHARPLGPHAFVNLAGIGGAADDHGERFVRSWQVQTLKLQRKDSRYRSGRSPD